MTWSANARPWTMLLVVLLGIGTLGGFFVGSYWHELGLRNETQKVSVRIMDVTADGSLLNVRFQAWNISRCDSLVVEISSKQDFSSLWPLGGGIIDDWRAGYTHVLVPDFPTERGWMRLVVKSCQGKRRAMSKSIAFSLRLRE